MASGVISRTVVTAGAVVLLAAMVAAPAAARSPGSRVVQLAAGNGHTCALLSDTGAYCWGRGAEGQLGDGSTVYRSGPVAIAAPHGVSFTQLTAGQAHTCGVGSNAKAYCWGMGDYGQLGDGATANRSSPVAVAGPAGVGFTELAAGDRHTCALGSDTRTYCWGIGNDGQLGDGATANRSSPVEVATPPGVSFTELAAGVYHTCALASDTGTYCWGMGGMGQLGDGGTVNRSSPVAVAAPPGVTFTQLAAGGFHTCGLGSDTRTYCWGLDETGQLGDGGTARWSRPVEVAVPAGVTFTRLTAGSNHTCALGSDTRTYCWGYGYYGQVGDGGTVNRSSPVEVAVPAGVTLSRLTAGWYHTCALGSDSTVYCWGLNETGQLGDGSITDRSSPVGMPPLPSPAGPLPPTGVSATAGDREIAVSWTVPADLGSGALTGYTATTSPGGNSCTSVTTACLITGLTNGTAYTVAVTATTTVGTSAASDPSASVTPVAGPLPPTGVSATADDREIAVSWTVPADLGSGTLTRYTATTSPGGNTCTSGTATTCTITGLTNGTAYTVTVTATTTVGTSTASGPSAPVTPVAGPLRPSGVSATAGDRQLVVSWTVPVDLGSGRLTGYIATTSPGGKTCASVTATTCTITGLVNGTAYTVTVTATTTVGTSAASDPSAPVTPAAGPLPPTGVTATAGDGQLVVSWTAPVDLGSGRLTGYTATTSPGGSTCASVIATTCTITGLVNDTAYTVAVTATTTVGTSDASVPSAAVTPAAGPPAPTGVTATAGDKAITVSWISADTGGQTPTKYTATASPGGKTCTISSSSSHSGLCTINGLTNGTAYTVTMTATTKAGTSPLSSPSAPATPAAVPPADRPQPPVVTAVKPQSEAIAVSWQPGSLGAGTLLGYTASAAATNDPCSSASTPCITTRTTGKLGAIHLTTTTADPSTCTSTDTDAQACTITGLTNGVSYAITVVAHTTAGDSGVDLSGPVVTVTPGDRTLVHGSRFTTAVTATDPSGIGRSYLTGADGAGLPFSYPSATVPAGADGDRTVTWIVLDSLGNQSTASSTVIVDNTAPAVTFGKAPRNGARIARTTTITAAASDRNGIARVQLLVNGKPVADDTRAAFAFVLNPAKYGRKFTVQIRAYDRAGNSRSTSRRTYHR
ncbi:Protein sidekick-2 [Actinoplanes sp. SE50]|uniref:RCC1 domain-containing protein n=1 Tax=unclassified Actinoplanes TaxID=2626549 RepID=UPI00023EBF5C|nr:MULTISPECIES: fibronectin type III domain-containing protein [unclassified Actinoplanes]AEV85753.1 Protein sidekick-2 [Actinoplanes sp. SE50/110]ATO84146.1 Protein sidekick-2 [Actinoplanes sp. SE50]SLM01556.1 hypothetical protein ACSP50_4792 [Actinoplanes sp. SE50/110]